MSRRWSLKRKNNKIVYDIININENTKDKDCINADNENEKKYQSVMKQAGKTSKLWDNTGVTMNIDVPAPPKPNNYDRLLDYRKKNVLRPSIQQSMATIYLFKHGYVLGKDYEAYQAIEIHNKLLKTEKDEKNKEDLINERNKPNNIKDLSLLDKIPKEKNIYPILETQKNNDIEISSRSGNVKKINFGWKRTQIPLPEIEVPQPSAPPEPELFRNNFSKFNKTSSLSSEEDYHIEC